MNKIHICRGCRRTIDGEFLYCPWCGFSRLNSEDLMNHAYEQLEVVQQKGYEFRLERMYNQLNELEKELDSMVLSSEMHK